MKTESGARNAAKFWVWMGAQWREVDPKSGLIRGCRRKARFVYQQRGRLKMAKRTSVLRGLQALAAGLPSSVREGLPLPRIRSRRRPSYRWPRTESCRHCHLDLNHDLHSTAIEPQSSKVDASVQVSMAQSRSTQTGFLLKMGPTLPKRIQQASVQDIVPGVKSTAIPDNRKDVDVMIKKPGPKSKTVKKDDKLEDKVDSKSSLKPEMKPSSHIDKSKLAEDEITIDNSDLDKNLASRRTRRRAATPTIAKRYVTSNIRRSLPSRLAKKQTPLGNLNRVDSREIVTKADIHESEADSVRLLRGTPKQRLQEQSSSSANPLTEIRNKGKVPEIVKSKHGRKQSELGESYMLYLSDESDNSDRPIRATRQNSKVNGVNASSSANVKTEKMGMNHSKDITIENLVNHITSRLESITEKKKGQEKDQWDTVTVSSDSSAAVRELTIEGGDVALLRSHLLHTRKDFDAARFDSDECYKVRFFYAITPLVHVERNRRMESMLRERFAQSLGLRSVGEADKENTPVQAKTKQIRPKAQPPSNRRKEYSSQEDEALVRWVSAGDRAGLVNGNRVWRQLEAEWRRLAGSGRSWQSLRNRYLRHLLPGLSRLPLPTPLASRLRSMAATGKLAAKKPWRRNSLFERSRREPGAASRAARPRPDHDASRVSPPRKRLRASSAPRQPESPSYGSLLRQFTSRHRSSSPLPDAEPRTRRRKLFNPHHVL